MTHFIKYSVDPQTSTFSTSRRCIWPHSQTMRCQG